MYIGCRPVFETQSAFDCVKAILACAKPVCPPDIQVLPPVYVISFENYIYVGAGHSRLEVGTLIKMKRL